MYLKHIKIVGFKRFREFEMDLNHHLSIIVGDNETGKTTIIEAIDLVLSGQLNGRSINYGLDPHWFNNGIVSDYCVALSKDTTPSVPRILIEAYLDDEGSDDLAKLSGTNNSKGENCPGVYLAVELDEDLADDFQKYVGDCQGELLMPVEYFRAVWRSFADNSVAARTIPFGATAIDATLARASLRPNRYIAQIIAECLDEEQRRTLAVAYRQQRQGFLCMPEIEKINEHLSSKKGSVTDKKLTMSLDMSARSTWDAGIAAHLDDIPFDSIGKGEQCCVQMKLAIEAADKHHVLLIEEPENHLSHSNMYKLVNEISSRSAERQIVMTTHSSFVLNKLGIENIKLISFDGNTTTLADLPKETNEYFMKLPGYDTLRLLLAAKAILVEGPSDELVVQKAYLQEHGKLPLASRVDVIAVRSLSFTRFLEIGRKLRLAVRVVTDNDGKVPALEEKYKEYLNGGSPSIAICYDSDAEAPTLEDQMLKVNSLEEMNGLLRKSLTSKSEMLLYMNNNKTDWALRLFASGKKFTIPDYIQRAINE